MPKIAMAQNTDPLYLSTDSAFVLRSINDDKEVLSGQIETMGEKWNKFWWRIDFSECKSKGNYYLEIIDNGKVLYKSNRELPIIIEDDLLWDKTWYETALHHLHIRAGSAYKPEGGWKDCGSTLQEVSSHIIMLNALCDLLELRRDELSSTHQDEILDQLITGADYVTLCQDKAQELGYKEGAVVHEIRENFKVVTGNVAKTSMILARVSRLLKEKNPDLAEAYLQRSIKSYKWISQHGPVLHWEYGSEYFAITHGAPYDLKKPPDEWMTRDLLMMMWASLELFRSGELEYKTKAVDYAAKIIKRQVSKEKAEEGLYGHFYTYDSYDFTEKANIHCGAWNENYKAYNQGGHFPHYLVPLTEMINLWPEDPAADSWRQCVHSFAFNYFIPATFQNPFRILPAGYYKNEGLLNWSGWYHGHNKIFGYAAGLAMEFYNLYQDQRFIEIAAGNLQWITGLHSGFHENDEYFSASMIVGVGNRSKEDWDNMRGTITNGFQANEQFTLSRPGKENDLPLVFGDEGGIHHPAGWISGISRYYRYLKR